MTDGEMARKTVDQIQRNGECDGDARKHYDPRNIWTEHSSLEDDVHHIQYGENDQSDDQVTQVARHMYQMRNAECGMRNKRKTQRTLNQFRIPHSAFRNPVRLSPARPH